MKELGVFLRETRENNGVSIEEASDDLKIDRFLLENLEDGNVRAFKDVLSMKEIVKEYAKYLGLDPESVTDEFNDFLFEHTSKISLSDILEAEKGNKEKQNSTRIASPYTIVHKKKLNKKMVAMVCGIVLAFILLILFIIYLAAPPEKKITNELKEERIEVKLYEFTY